MPWFDDIKKYYLFRGLLRRFAWPILTLFMLDQGLSIAEVGIITLVGYIISIVSEIPSGAVADTIGHKKTVVYSMLGQGLSMALYLGGSFWWMLAGTGLYMLAGSFMTGTREALFYERLVELGRADEHQKLVGRSRSVSGAVGTIFMLTSSLAYVYAWWLPFVIGIIHFTLGAYVISTFTEAKRTVSVKKREGYAELLRHFGEAWQQVKTNTFLYWIIIINGTMVGVYMSTAEFHQVVLNDVKLAAIFFGTFYAFKRANTFLLSPLAHRISARFTAPSFLCTSGVLVVAHMLVLPFTTNILVVAGAMIFGSAILNVFKVVVNDYTNTLLPSGSRATALSIKNLISHGLSILCIGIITLLSDALGIRLVIGVIGIIMAALLAISIPKLYIARRQFVANPTL